MASDSLLSNGVSNNNNNNSVVPDDCQLNQFVDVANKVADAAGEIIRKYFRNKFEVLHKDDSSKFLHSMILLFLRNYNELCIQV